MAQESIQPVCSPESCHSRAERCPLCGGDNACRVAKGHLYKGECWCFQIPVPSHLVRRLMESEVEFTCLCRPCLETVSRAAESGGDTNTMLAEIRAAIDQHRAAEPDFYLEDGNVVFTAAYHLKRGACCSSGCRHCPY